MNGPARWTSVALVLSLCLQDPGPCEADAVRPSATPGEHAAGRTIAIPAGADLQRALEAARPGDILQLQAGASFRGPFALPKKSGDGWIVLRSSAHARLPAGDSRVDPSHASLMPKLEAEGGSVLSAAPGAHHYRLEGIEIRPLRGTFVENLVQLGQGNARRVDALPAFIALDHCYVHGDPDLGARRGVALNSATTEVSNSYFSDFKEVGADSQAIAGWGGPGPFKIVNNHLEAAGENLMFGGADPRISGLVPSDIDILRNHLVKPPEWKTQPAQTRPWSVKNLFELKNARRVHVEGNLLENNWVQSQSGFAVLFTVRNQDGAAPWSVVEDVTFVNNVVRHAAAGIYVLGHDNNFPSQQVKRIRIQNNLFDDIGGPTWGGGGTLLQLIGGAADVTFDHNTAFQTDNVIMAEGPPLVHFVFSNNIVRGNRYGIIGTGTGPGLATIAKYFPDAQVHNNAIVGAKASDYPAGNFFPAELAELALVTDVHTAPRLKPGSRFSRAASDGRDIGVDVDALERARTVVRVSETRADAR